MDKHTINVLLVGVGGQGTILASKVLSEGLLALGFDVKMSEIHGMAQRGGSVSTHVRYGRNVRSPVLCRGEADLLVGFEKMEALRWISYLSSEGMLIVNNQEIHPMPVILGQAEYPSELEHILSNAVSRVLVVEAAKVARKLGNPKTTNMVLLGTVINALGLADDRWNETIRECVPRNALEVNQRAFFAGLELA